MAEQEWLKDIWYLFVIFAVHAALFIMEHWLALLVFALVLYVVCRPVWRRLKRERSW